MTVNTKVIKCLLKEVDRTFIPLWDGSQYLRVQVLPNVSFLAKSQKNTKAAFIKDQEILVVWDDSPKGIVSWAAKLQEQIMVVFATGLTEEDEESPIKEEANVVVTEVFNDTDEAGSDIIPEDGIGEPRRKIIMNQAGLSGATLILIIAALGSGWRWVALEIKVDHNWMRLAFLLVLLPQIWLALVSLNTQTEGRYMLTVWQSSSSCNASLAAFSRCSALHVI